MYSAHTFILSFFVAIGCVASQNPSINVTHTLFMTLKREHENYNLKNSLNETLMLMNEVPIVVIANNGIELLPASQPNVTILHETMLSNMSMIDISLHIYDDNPDNEIELSSLKQKRTETISTSESFNMQALKMIFAALYGLIALISIIGNVLVHRIIWSYAKQRTTTNILILSLTLSDILTTSVNIPFTCIRTMLNDWPLPDIFCFLIPTIQVAVVYASTLTMAAIGVHRFRSVRLIRVKVNGLVSTTVLPYVMTRSKIIIWILMIWAGSFVLALPHSIFNRMVDGVPSPFAHEQQEIRLGRRCRAVYPPNLEERIPLWLSVETLITQFLLPISITATLYLKIGTIIERQGQLARHYCDELNRRMCKAKRRKQLILGLIVLTFTFCWLPLNIYHLLIDSHILHFKYVVFTLLHLLAMCSVCINPFLYFLILWKKPAEHSQTKDSRIVVKCEESSTNATIGDAVKRAEGNLIPSSYSGEETSKQFFIKNIFANNRFSWLSRKRSNNVVTTLHAFDRPETIALNYVHVQNKFLNINSNV